VALTVRNAMEPDTSINLMPTIYSQV